MPVLHRVVALKLNPTAVLSCFEAWAENEAPAAVSLLEGSQHRCYVFPLDPSGPRPYSLPHEAQQYGLCLCLTLLFPEPLSEQTSRVLGSSPFSGTALKIRSESAVCANLPVVLEMAAAEQHLICCFYYLTSKEEGGNC